MHYAHKDVSVQAVDAVGADIVVHMVVTDLDHQCPDARLRPFGRWSSALWSTDERFMQGIDPFFRVSVVWPDIA